MMLYSLIKFPLVFISGVFLPVSQMPAREQLIAFFSPLTCYMDLVRYSTGGGGSFSPYVDDRGDGQERLPQDSGGEPQPPYVRRPLRPMYPCTKIKILPYAFTPIVDITVWNNKLRLNLP